MGGGSAQCYLPFLRDKGIWGLLTSGFSQKDTIPCFPLYPLQTWLEEFQIVVIGGWSQEPLLISSPVTRIVGLMASFQVGWPGDRLLTGMRLFCVPVFPHTEFANI